MDKRRTVTYDSLMARVQKDDRQTPRPYWLMLDGRSYFFATRAEIVPFVERELRISVDWKSSATRDGREA